MIVSYLDSSGLLRLCLAEGDVSLVEAALASVPITSGLALVEVPNAISARFHRGAIAEQERNDLLRLAEEVLRLVNTLEVSSDVLDEAVRVGSVFLVRALDALHLGTAVLAARQQARWGNQLRFCTADRRQAEAAMTLFGREHVDLLAPLPTA